MWTCARASHETPTYRLTDVEARGVGRSRPGRAEGHGKDGDRKGDPGDHGAHAAPDETPESSSRRPSGRSRLGVSRPWARINASSRRRGLVGPSATTRPPSSTIVREQVSATSARSCVATRRVAPRPCTIEMSCRRARGSRPLVGSSKRRISGPYARSPASPTRFFSPPLSRCGSAPFEAGETDLRERDRDTTLQRVAGQPELAGTESHVFADARAEELVVRILEEQAHAACASRRAFSGRRRSPKSRTSPSPCPWPGSGKSPITCRSSVDLPAPLGPMRATHSPAATRNDTSSNAGVASS